MKKYIFIILSTFLFKTVHSQVIQKGLVREFNSGKQSITGVSILFKGSLIAESDINGKFVVKINSGKNYGDSITFIEAKKSGYEVVNEDQIQYLQINSENVLPKDIILAKAGVLQSAKAEYSIALHKVLTQNYITEKTTLVDKVNASQLNVEEFNIQIKLLNEQFEKQNSRIDALAQAFARVNFDDVSEAHKESLSLCKVSKLDEAIATLELQDLSAKILELINEIKHKDSVILRAEYEEAKLIEQKNQYIDMLSTLVDMYTFDFKPLEAESIMDTLLMLDTTDLTILQNTANFYRDQLLYDKAIDTYQRIINHPQAEPWQLANVYCYLGRLFKIKGDQKQALAHFEKYLAANQEIFQMDSSSFHKNNLAISYSKMGEMHTSGGILNKALEFNEKYYLLEKELADKNPDKIDFKQNLAYSYAKLGLTHNSLGNLLKALEFYEKFNTIQKDLCDSYPNNVDFKHDLAVSYSNLGSTHSSLGNLKLAMEFYERVNTLKKELSDTCPDNVNFKNDLAISYQFLGNTQSQLGNLKKAFEYYNQDFTIKKDLSGAFPNNADFKNGLAISFQYLGITIASLGNLNKALECYNSAFLIRKELSEAYPNNLDFKIGLAFSYQYLGNTYSSAGDTDKALEFYEKYNALKKELYEAYPNHTNFKNGLAISYQYLGNTYRSMGNQKKSMELYENFKMLMTELHDSNPYNPEYKMGLAISYERLGLLYSSMKNRKKALECFEKYNELEKELHIAYPASVEYKKSLAISYYNLATEIEKTDKNKAIEFATLSVKHFSELITISPENASFMKNYSLVSNYLRELIITKP
ncbi:MAG: tetratricopeptide repeat protein [Bacteroidetes bacterium]|nr:tetratricopeptide repeat protein [Bacteroidota bacterium]